MIILDIFIKKNYKLSYSTEMDQCLWILYDILGCVKSNSCTGRMKTIK